MVALAVLAAIPHAASAQYITSGQILSVPPVEPREVISWGTESRQYGHLRVPEGEGPFPVVVLLHGGCWLSIADPEYTGSLAADFTDHGIATWSVEYRTIDVPGGGWPNTFVDVGRGIDFLREIAITHPIDLARVVVLGHSSGGHLAMWSAGRARIDAESPIFIANPLPVSGVVSLAGPGQLDRFREMDQLVCGGDVVDVLMDGSPAEVPSHYAAGSPADLLPTGVPMRLLTGAADGIVPTRFGEAFEAVARAAGDDVKMAVLPNAAHFEPMMPGTAAAEQVRAAIDELLKIDRPSQ